MSNAIYKGVKGEYNKRVAHSAISGKRLEIGEGIKLVPRFNASSMCYISEDEYNKYERSNTVFIDNVAVKEEKKHGVQSRVELRTKCVGDDVQRMAQLKAIGEDKCIITSMCGMLTVKSPLANNFCGEVVKLLYNFDLWTIPSQKVTCKLVLKPTNMTKECIEWLQNNKSTIFGEYSNKVAIKGGNIEVTFRYTSSDDLQNVYYMFKEIIIPSIMRNWKNVVAEKGHPLQNVVNTVSKALHNEVTNHFTKLSFVGYELLSR